MVRRTLAHRLKLTPAGRAQEVRIQAASQRAMRARTVRAVRRAANLAEE